MIPTHNTAAGAQKALQKIMRGESGAVLNPSFELFKTSTWPELREWIPWDMVTPSQRYRVNPEFDPHKPFTMVFLNGAKVICKGLHDPDNARGPNINWLWYDEGASDLDGLGWKLAIASVRVGNEPQAWTTTTPRGKDHWIYKLFMEQELPEEALAAVESTGRKMTEIFFGSIDDNKGNLDPTFYASMIATYSEGWLRQQELGGEFVTEGGILGNPAWFRNKVLDFLPDTVVMKSVIRYWDLAASEKKVTGKRSDDPDETVGTLLGWDGHDFYIMDQISGYWEYKEIKEKVRTTAILDGQIVPIYIEQEPGSGGKNQVADIASYPGLEMFSVRAHKPDGDKILRANLWFGEASAGRVWMLRGNWNDHFLSQLSSFPVGRHDDTIDSMSGARMCVAPIRQWRRVPFLAV
jgi:predicted phage terminase large subunit-like protein